MGHSANFDFPCLYRTLLGGTEFEDPLKSAMPGALFATAGWILTSLVFSFYVGNFANYSKTYGSIGGIIVLMMWLYFSAIILMLGGQLNAVMTEQKARIAGKRKEQCSRLTCIALFSRYSTLFNKRSHSK